MVRDLDLIRVVIAGEHVSDREHLRKLLALERRFRVLAEASNAGDAGRLARALKPDILLLDLATLGRLQPDAFWPRTIVMVPAIEKAQVLEAFRLGARGIVLKAAGSGELFKCVRTVMAGEYALGSEGLDILLRAFREVLLAQSSNGAKPTNGHSLSPRELDIIVGIATGRSNKEVGQECSISERTVKHHLTNIFNKIGVSSRLELALFAVNHNLVNGHAETSEERAESGVAETHRAAVRARSACGRG